MTAGAAAASGVLSTLTYAEVKMDVPAREPIPGLVIPCELEGKPAQKLVLGNFITMDEIRPTAEAMTVIDGKIQYIGRDHCDGLWRQLHLSRFYGITLPSHYGRKGIDWCGKSA